MLYILWLTASNKPCHGLDAVFPFYFYFFCAEIMCIIISAFLFWLYTYLAIHRLSSSV